jgi:hypothetical protein
MKNYKKIFFFSMMSVMSAIILLTLIELILRIDGRYADIAHQKLESSNTIWERPKSSKEYFLHPDLKVKIPVFFDQHGLRYKKKIRESYEKNIFETVGIFGDSFIENRRILYNHNLTYYLNKYDENKLYLNFGVDGYGLGQEYQRYKNYKNQLKMNHVIYVFSINDLANFFDNKLFKISKNGKNFVLKNVYDEDLILHKIFKIIGKLHIVYFIFDLNYKFKNIHYSSNQIKLNYKNKFLNKGIKNFKNREKNNSFLLTQDFKLKELDDEMLKSIIDFNTVLNTWKNEVEKTGGKFEIYVLPNKETRVLIKKILELNSIKHQVNYFKTNNENQIFKNYQIFFKYDGHLNEFGNLSMFYDIISNQKINTKKNLNLFAINEIEKINKYYNQNKIN